MILNLRPHASLLSGLVAVTLSMPATAWELSGSKLIKLHTRAGQSIVIGHVDFTPKGEESTFKLVLDHDKFKDFFLSMKEFKCLEGEEIQCHVPYPYANPSTVSRSDLRWLEHSLLFLYKQPKDFGARLWNGLYYEMVQTENGIVGTPRAVDLVQIGAPPADTSIPPYGPSERSEIPPDSRWIRSLSIE